MDADILLSLVRGAQMSARWTAEDERNFVADRTVLKKLEARGEEPSAWLAEEYAELSKRRAEAKRRRPKGEGGLYQRADGMWCVALELPSVDGKRRRKVICRKSRKDAVAQLQKVKAELYLSTLPEPSQPSPQP